MNIILIYFAKKYGGDWDQIFKALEAKEKVSLEELNKMESEIKEWSEKTGGAIRTIMDSDYPNVLKEAYKPPFVIYTKGNYKAINGKTTQITGNGEITKATEDKVKNTLAEVKDKVLVIDASNSTVNAEIVKASESLDDLPRLFILDKGLSTFDKEIKNTDLVITEYPDEITESTNAQSRQVNRIAAAISKELVLIQSVKSTEAGNVSLNHLVSSYLNLGKEIYAFPGDLSKNDGNSELIKQGATYITSYGEDVERS